jgi:hypothetical protein
MKYSSAPLATSIASILLAASAFAGQPPIANPDSATAYNTTPVTISPLTNDYDPDLGDTVHLITVGAPAHGTASIDSGNIVYTPAGDFAGTVEFSYTIADSGGSTASSTIRVLCHPSSPVVVEDIIAGPRLLGDAVPREPAGTTFRAFRIPAIYTAGGVTDLAVATTIGNASGTKVAILARNLASAPGTREIIARAGDAAPGMADAVFKTFTDPVCGTGGSTAFLANVAGPGYTAANNTGLWATGTSLTPGPQLVVREGAEPAGIPGAQIKTITNFSLRGNQLVYIATLVPGLGGVTTANATAAFYADISGSHLMFRLGDTFFNRDNTPTFPITSFNLLSPSAGSVGHGGHHVQGTLCFLSKFSNGPTAIMTPRLMGGYETAIKPGDPVVASGYLPSQVFISLRSPCWTNFAEGFAFSAHTTAATGILTTPQSGVFYHPHTLGTATTIAVGRATAANLSPLTFENFIGVAAADRQNIAFTSTLANPGGPLLTGANNAALFWTAPGGLRSVARLGDAAPGTNGGVFKAIENFSLPLGGGPLFTATLVRGTATVPAPGNVTASNDRGLWTVDRDGYISLALREGGAYGAATIRSFRVLGLVAGSPGQTRSFGTERKAAVQAALSDGTQALIFIALP